MEFNKNFKFTDFIKGHFYVINNGKEVAAGRDDVEFNLISECIEVYENKVLFRDLLEMSGNTNEVLEEWTLTRGSFNSRLYNLVEIDPEKEPEYFI